MTTSATKEEILKMMKDQMCFIFKYEKVGFYYGKAVKGKEREKTPRKKTISICFRVKHPNIKEEFDLLNLSIEEGDEDINKEIESFINSIWLLSEFRERLEKSYIIMWMHDPVSEFKLTVDWK